MTQPLSSYRPAGTHHHGAFGADAFGRRAETFARWFGTPTFLIGQTVLVLVWIALNVVMLTLRWDPYPFILLNLAFSLQAAYAAPLILLAQTRQADRDKAVSEADATHREELAAAGMARQDAAIELSQQIQVLLVASTTLTEDISGLPGRSTTGWSNRHSRASSCSVARVPSAAFVMTCAAPDGSTCPVAAPSRTTLERHENRRYG